MMTRTKLKEEITELLRLSNKLDESQSNFIDNAISEIFDNDQTKKERQNEIIKQQERLKYAIITICKKIVKEL